MRNKVLIQTCCCILSFLFAYTGASKLLSLHEFEQTLQQIPYVRQIDIITAILIPVVELVISILLLVTSTQLVALLVSLFLLLVFTAYITISLAFQSKLPCSCGGVIASMSWTQHIFFNLFFILVALTGIKLCMHQNRGSRKPAEKSRHHFLF